MVMRSCYAKRGARAQGRRFPSGFSLVELMIVIAIMLVLAAMATARLFDAQKKAYEAGVVSFLRILQTNQESYRLAKGSYADNFTDLGLVALAPAAPGDLLAPDQWPQRVALFAQIGPSRVYAAQAPQRPPAKTPPPPDTGDPGFGTAPGKRPGKAGGAPAAPGLGGGGSGGAPAKGGGPGQGSGMPRPRRGPRTDSPSGGTPLGGGTGAPVPDGSAAPQAGGGSDGSLSPSPAPAPTTNVVLKHNYIFTLQRPTLTTWTCTVAPVRDRGNSKFFYLDQTGVMRVELGKFAGSASPQL